MLLLALLGSCWVFNMKKSMTDVSDFSDIVEQLFNDIIEDLEKSSEEAEYDSPEDYKNKTGKRFRMTKDQKGRGLNRDEAFKEFLNLSN